MIGLNDSAWCNAVVFFQIAYDERKRFMTTGLVAKMPRGKGPQILLHPFDSQEMLL